MPHAKQSTALVVVGGQLGTQGHMRNEKQRHGRVEADNGYRHPKCELTTLQGERRREHRVKSNGNRYATAQNPGAAAT